MRPVSFFFKHLVRVVGKIHRASLLIVYKSARLSAAKAPKAVSKGNKMNQATFFWHDYETWGVNPHQDRAAQFAGVRTDAELNIIGKPLMIYAKPTPDYLPDPGACLITGITPQQALENGLPEAEFIAQIHEQMAQPNTCTVGYNSIRFDDEVTRQTLFRNFYDPYAREWQNGNSRWDLIDVVRLCHALRPEGVVWPKRDDGETTSFRLEALTAANQIEHGDAHDALSDVYATIELAKLIKSAQPKLFEFALSLRFKNTAQQLLNLQTQAPVVHVSSKIPASRHAAGFVMPLAAHPTNRNSIIVCDLYQDPSVWLHQSAEEIIARLYTPVDELPEGVERPALKEIRINRSPMVAPTNVLDDAALERLGWDLDAFRERWKQVRNTPGVAEKVAQVFGHSPWASDKQDDVDHSLYSGGFLSPQDRRLCQQVIHTPPAELGRLFLPFEDERLPEMLWRYRGRNYPDTLTAEETAQWQAFCRERVTAGEGRNIQALRKDLALRTIAAQTEHERDIISAIIDYIDVVAAQVGLN